MKILHICNVPLIASHPDSQRKLDCHPGRWVLDLARAQQRYTALQPELLMTVPGASCDFDGMLEGVPVHYLQTTSRFRATTFLARETHRLAARARQLQPDLVHAHGSEGAHVLAAQRAKMPYVVTAQGVHAIINPIVQTPFWHRQKIIEFLERRALFRTRHVIAKSAYIADWLQRLFPHLRIHRIPNTYNEAIVALPPVPKEPHTIIFVGSLDRRKGLHVLAAAMVQVQVRFPSVRLCLIGSGRNASAYARQQEACLRTLMGARCEFLERLTQVEVGRQVARAAVLVAPSLEEMFGNQVIEALLLRTHCVVSSGTAMAENIARFGNGTVFQNGSADDLAQALIRCLEGSCTSDAEKARQRVLDYMNPEQVALQHAGLYNGVLAETAIRHPASMRSGAVTGVTQPISMAQRLPLRCVHIGNIALPSDHPDYHRVWQHPGKWVLDLACAQKENAALEPYIVVSIPGASQDYETRWQGIPCLFLRCQSRLRATTFFVYECARTLAFLRRLKPDLVHAHGTEGAHLLIAQLSGRPYVVTIQGLYSSLTAMLGSQLGLRAKFITWLEKCTLRRAHHAIAKSAFVASILHRQYPRLQLYSIPNTYSPSILNLAPVVKEPYSIVYVGTLSKWKGVHILSRAIEQLALHYPALTLRIIGSGANDGGYGGEVLASLRRSLGHRLIHMDQIPRDDVFREVARSQVLVAPSLWEMFGNQAVEALLAQTHCVVSSDTALSENIQRFGNGTIFRNGDANDLAEKLAQVLAQSEFPEAVLARQRILDYMNPLQVARLHAELYEAIVAKA